MKKIKSSMLIVMIAIGFASFVSCNNGSYNIVVFLTICISYANNCFTL